MGQMSRVENVAQPEMMTTVRSGSVTPSRRRKIVTRVGLAVALLAGTAAVGDFADDYWRTGRFLVATDDAYVKADYTTVAPKISGYLAQVLVGDNEVVKTGQVLARIDDRDFRAALAQAQADVAAADAAVRNFDAQISLQQAQIAEAVATVAATRASLAFAEADASRYHELAGTGFGTVQRAQQTQAASERITSQLLRDQASVLAAQREIAVLVTAKAEASAHAERARAVEQQARLNLGYTTITAAMDGTVGARTLRVGQYVTAGTQLMAVVPVDAAYVVANFKETQLVHVHPGQPVKVAVDGQPGLTFVGHVDSVSPASGLEFALLPPDNATGNFTKIVQRIPVKIVFDGASQVGLLRSGMSVEPTIDTRPAAISQPVRTASASTQPG
jgi:membrane fusion protein (multidrug efflux system)